MAIKDFFKRKKVEVSEAEKEENQSLQFNFSKKREQEIVEMVLADKENYEGSRREYMELRKESIKLYEGVREPKNLPWQNCSNISTMVTTAVVDLLAAKLFPLVWNTDAIHWWPQNKASGLTVNAVRKFMRWVCEQAKIYEDRQGLHDFIDILLHQLLIDGIIIIKLFWDRQEKDIIAVEQTDIDEITGETIYEERVKREIFENPSLEFVPVENCLFPYDAKDEQSCDSIIHLTYYKYSQLKEMQAKKLIKNIDEKFESALREIVIKKQGTERSRLDAAGLMQVSAKTRRYSPELLEWYGKYDYNDDGVEEECVFLVCGETKTYLSGYPLVARSKTNTRPWLIRPFFRRGSSIYGKSVPEQMRHLQKLMDAIHNQRVDAGSIAIAPPVFYRPASGFDPEQHLWGPTQCIPTDDPKNDVLIPTISTNAIQYSFQEERVILGLIERLTSVSAYQAGMESDVIKTRATATGTMAIIQQGQQKFNLLAKRVARIVADLLTRLKMLYEENMPPGMAETIVGKDGKQIFPEGLSARDIIGQHFAYLIVDMEAANLAIKQEMMIAKYQALIADPLVNVDPARMWQLRADYLEALGEENPEKYIGSRPESLPTINQDAEEEFNAMMAGRRVEVSPQENAMQHLVAHAAQVQTDRFKQAPPNYQALLLQHIAETQELSLRQMQQQFQAQLAQRGVNEYSAEASENRGEMAGRPEGTSGNRGVGEEVPAGAGPGG